MGGIQQRVKDVLSGQAKTRIEQLFVVSKAQHRRHLAVAQRVRDQINRAYNDVPLGAQPCLDELIEWLDRCIFWLKNRDPQHWRDICRGDLRCRRVVGPRLGR
jgi:hypothetical protein